MKRSKILALVCMMAAAVILLANVPFAQAADTEIKVTVDGTPLSFDVPPTIENGRTLVPMRAIFEAMGAKVDWVPETREVIATKGGTEIELKIDSAQAKIGGMAKQLDVPAKIINNRTMVPLRFVSEALGGKVYWVEAARKIVIVTKNTEFSFVHFTDPHTGYGPGTNQMKLVAAELGALNPRPAFALNSGDITEIGSREQYATYQSIIAPLTVPVYNTRGNHDSRWSDAGKAIFSQNYGQSYYSFDYGGIHFVALDSSVTAETFGHLDPAQLSWLADDLAQVGKEMPVIIFLHHPPFFETQFMDNEDDLLKAVEGYNVRAVLTGHGHLDLAWKQNGIQFFMTKAVMEGGYKILTVQGDQLYVYNKPVGGEKVLAATVPLTKQTQPELDLSLTQDNAGTWGISLHVSNLPEISRAEYRVDGGAWSPLALMPTGSWAGKVDTKGLLPGTHTVAVRAINAAGENWLAKGNFQLDGAASQQWSYQTGGSIQGSPAINGNAVYVGSTDGRLYALAKDSGALLWQFKTEGAVTSTPAVYGNLVIFASADKNVYAVNASTGKEVWRFTTGGPVIASPMVANSTVFIGSTDGNMYALELNSGRKLWQFVTGDLIRSRPAYGNGLLYFGSWDGNVYGLDAQTGTKVWQTNLARLFYFAPATSSVVFDNGKVYVTTPNDAQTGNYSVYALDAATGQVVWRIPEKSGYQTPVVDHTRIYLGNLNGMLYALDKAAGNLVWSLNTGGAMYDASPVMVKGELAVSTLKGMMVGVDPATGKESWRYRLGDSYVFGTPVASGNVLYVGTMDGVLHAITINK